MMFLPQTVPQEIVDKVEAFMFRHMQPKHRAAIEDARRGVIHDEIAATWTPPVSKSRISAVVVNHRARIVDTIEPVGCIMAGQSYGSAMWRKKKGKGLLSDSPNIQSPPTAKSRGAGAG